MTQVIMNKNKPAENVVPEQGQFWYDTKYETLYHIIYINGRYYLADMESGNRYSDLGVMCAEDIFVENEGQFVHVPKVTITF